MRIAHISDLHFVSPTLNPFQIFSKRIVGNINYLLNRKKTFSLKNCYRLIDQLKHLQIDAVIISGDLSTTSSKKEFAKARAFIQKLKDLSIEVYIIPGNHDNYTKSAYHNKNFYRYLGSVVDFSSDATFSYSLEQDGIQIRRMEGSYWIILMDTTWYGSFFDSNGIFSSDLKEKLELVLATIPQQDKILLVNHFPFFQQEGPLKDLKNGPDLENVLKRHPNLTFYLHGHTHRNSVTDLRHDRLPVVLDAGCITSKHSSTWNYIDLGFEKTSIDVYCAKDDNLPWEVIKRIEV